jgi:hypothetical protein
MEPQEPRVYLELMEPQEALEPLVFLEQTEARAQQDRRGQLEFLALMDQLVPRAQQG